MPLSFNGVPLPSEGEAIGFRDGQFQVPDRPVIPFIEGDGTGRDIWRASRRVFDAAVAQAYGGRRRVIWYEVFAGEKAFARFGNWLPEDTINAVRALRVAIKGPLTTPVGGGIRSLNVTLRQVLDLYACIRPVKHYAGVPSPVRHPERMDLVIFRENTEDVYAGIEFREGSPEALRLIEFLDREMGKKVKRDSGVGIKPMSVSGSKRLVRMGIEYARDRGRNRVTLVHKGNIQKFTEGAFRDWGYQVAKEEFGDLCVTEEELAGGRIPEGKILVNDRIADSMFQQVLTRPEEYQVVCTPNLNGDYLSDACAAQVGGLGMAPGANCSREYAFFEATHGTAPKYADQDVINPGSVLLSGVMMFQALGWREAAELIEGALAATIAQKRVTYDLERLLPGATRLKTSEFASALIENLSAVEARA